MMQDIQQRHIRLGTAVVVSLALVVAVWGCRSAWGTDQEKTVDRPNFVIVLADDLGYGDLGCYGNEVVQTPNLNRFATEGMRLTDCYAAAANCSPARAGLMTGRTPYRLGIHNWIPYGSPMHLRKREITVATLLQRAGYDTAHVGKWHLNGMFNQPQQPQPSDHGFHYWFSTQNNALPNHHNPDNFVRNGKPAGKLDGYSGPLVAGEAIEWLNRKRDKDKPFFLYVCFHEPHEPIATAERFTAMYAQFDDPSKRAHHGNITQMDDAFGRLMKALDDADLRDNTFVFFTSDNGPAITRIHPHGSTGPLRAKKGHLYEGGIRVPGMIRWPGHIKPGTVSSEPVCGVDLLPTLCDIAGVPVPEDRTIDGVSLVPLWESGPLAPRAESPLAERVDHIKRRGGSLSRETPLYWQFNFAASKPKVAMRVGDWKILATLTGPELKPSRDIRSEDQRAIHTAELESFELYNLRDDISETTNLAEQQPQRVETMANTLRDLYHEIRAETPIWPAWKSPGYEAKRIQWPRYNRKEER